jgi:hypothetical protein
VPLFPSFDGGSAHSFRAVHSSLFTPPDTLARPDVLVVGGGMAGVMAASSNVLGGQGTTGGVAGFCGDTARVNRPFAELIGRLEKHGFIEPYRPNDDRRAYDLEWCAYFLQEMVVAAGVELLLHTRVIAARAERGLVTEVTLSTAGGPILVHPRHVIDASGGCVVAASAGFPFIHEGANRQLPMSLYFTLWDTGRPVTPVLPEGCPRWRSDDEIPMTSLHCFPSGKVEVKMKVVGFDAADGRGRSAAEVFARRQMHGLIHYLQTVGFRGRRLDTHVLASVSRGIGVREERRIVGEHMLTEAEARRSVLFHDAVAVNTYHIDYHWPDRAQRAGTGITDMLDPHHLPLRMMIPRAALNLLVPGRGASGDQMAMSAYRVMAVVAQMGFAAGLAARQAVERGVLLPSLDIPALQAEIQAGGQSLNLSDYGEYLRCDQMFHEVVPFAEPVELSLRLGTNAVFEAGWSRGSRRMKSRRREKSWSTPAVVDDQPVGEDRETVMLDGGFSARPSVEGDVLRVELAAIGASAMRHGEILSKADPRVRPAMVATRVGLAVLYADPEGQVRLWHGSVERLQGEEPVAAARRLDAPPLEVHSSNP